MHSTHAVLYSVIGSVCREEERDKVSLDAGIAADFGFSSVPMTEHTAVMTGSSLNS